MNKYKCDSEKERKESGKTHTHTHTEEITDEWNEWACSAIEHWIFSELRMDGEQKQKNHQDRTNSAIANQKCEQACHQIFDVTCKNVTDSLCSAHTKICLDVKDIAWLYVCALETFPWSYQEAIINYCRDCFRIEIDQMCATKSLIGAIHIKSIWIYIPPASRQQRAKPTKKNSWIYSDCVPKENRIKRQ